MTKTNVGFARMDNTNKRRGRTTVTSAVKESNKEPTIQRSAAPFFRRTLGVALLGSILLWASFPPLGLWPLAWLAPIPWLWLVAQPLPLGRKGYWALWLASFVFWAALLQGIRLAHILLVPAWLVLSAYVAVYLPLFVGMSRMLVHRWRWPLALAAPATWVGLEFVRAYMVTGFSLAMLGQSQVPFPLVLQTADIFGTYGPSFLLMLLASAVTLWMLPATRQARMVSSVAAFAAVIAALAYGSYRMQQTPAEGPVARVMLVQGSVDTVLDGKPGRGLEMVNHYRDLTFTNLDKYPPCDLVVWPESAFGEYPECELADPQNLPERIEEIAFRRAREGFAMELADYASRLNEQNQPGRTNFLVGGNTLCYDNEGMQVYNATFLISPQGQLGSRYFKTHLVMFGEYIPFGDWLPIIYEITPIQPVTRGREYQSFQVAGLTFAPNICFESTIPQLVCRQTNDLARRGYEPDVLVNTTNDGWFYGSSILDLHFQCAVLRAIENRKPFLVAANTGISAVIDGNGRVLERGPNRDTRILVAEVRPDGRTSLFRKLGDWPAGACFAVSLIAVLLGRRRGRSSGTKSELVKAPSSPDSADAGIRGNE